MSQLIIAALIMGMLGSFHCVGMCGAIALSLPLKDNSDWAKFSGALVYNVGRIITYAVYGFMFGLFGKSIALFGYQQGLSIFLGVLILFYIILPKRFSVFNQNNFFLVFFEKLRQTIGRFFLKKNYSSLFYIGLLNGLLPCGLIFMASAAAVSTGDVLKSTLFMAFFGLGTLPMMWSVAFFGNYVGVSIRQKIRKAYPYMMTLIACLLILRGLGLGIAYLSPRVEMSNKIVQNCGMPAVAE